MENKEFDKNLKKAITLQKRKELKSYIQSVENSIAKPKKYNWLLVASIALLIGLSSFYLFNSKSLSNNELYNLHFTPYENVIEPIVRDKVNKSKKAFAFSLYEQGKYLKAIESFNKLTEKDSIEANTLLFFKANAYLQLEEFKKSEILFHKILINDNKEWKNESLWYLALISLKQDKKDAAITFLDKLQRQQKLNFKTEEIKIILNNIK
ncbi:hypothetical protein SAMN05216503_1405 [Polaribacter sp. KT25b]|uniref:tetratricopeptide repeat protein n=1 Tax=Polaribacter sp. KT25b TaxID=1855336 RepID=UPI00087CE597|nr:tetratricopeptide repeat protein [Polaribacter sp. KT25b]SDR92354.1 hypothetical protein SAMN05216503_1405 [Polaribacter sp. KT25b]